MMKLVKSGIGKIIYPMEKDKAGGPVWPSTQTKKEEKTGLSNWFQETCMLFKPWKILNRIF